MGRRWEIERIVVKPYAAMGALHAPLDALFELAAKRPLKPEEIEAVDIDMSHAAYHHGWWRVERPLTTIGAQMNVGYAIAVAIIDGAAMVKQFSPQRIDSDDVWALIPKITAHHEPAFDAGGQKSRANTRLRIRFADGTELETYREASRGVLDPLTNDEIVAKYETLTEGIVSPERRDRIRETVLRLEKLDDVGQLVALLAAPVSAPF